MYDYSGTLVMLFLGGPLVIILWVATALIVKMGIDIWRDK